MTRLWYLCSSLMFNVPKRSDIFLKSWKFCIMRFRYLFKGIFEENYIICCSRGLQTIFAFVYTKSYLLLQLDKGLDRSINLLPIPLDKISPLQDVIKSDVMSIITLIISMVCYMRKLKLYVILKIVTLNLSGNI